ncbi:hypothetical protein J1N35_044577 [Gossypium stocksii]|uniref:Reverse transcriptase domain-containing protein n=1 Tax=Gossypium stocksii TaxID=47602 RepID=A0A9D3U9R9_9ROSI|nr:hypothetical protein J1N35_044577 [Gossypium stocksii]
MELVRLKLGFPYGIDVGAIGSKGGLSLGWKCNLMVLLRSYSHFHIDADINDSDFEVMWRFTGFYGNPVEQLRSRLQGGGYSGTHRFRFEASWCLDQSFEGVVKQAWSGSSDNAVVKLAKVGQFIKLWNRSRSRELKRQRMRLEEHLTYLHAQNPTDDNLEEILEVQLGLNMEADKDEIFWEQRAGVHWLKNGDKNTSFFHKIAISRHNRNQIVGLTNEEGRWVSQSEEMLKAAVKFFGDLYTASDSVGRQISNNTLIAYEILHSLKTRKHCKQGNFALKLDMSKAYDQVEWDFFAGMMSRLGFCQEWIILIMRCVCSVTFTVGINDGISEVFSPSTGLRKGDPLSPYLFLICAEGLSTLLNEEKQKRLMIGASIGRERFTINHLLFADDCILFGDASVAEAHIVRSILKEYEMVSG